MLAILTAVLGVAAVLGDSLLFWSLFGVTVGLTPVVTTSARG